MASNRAVGTFVTEDTPSVKVSAPSPCIGIAQSLQAKAINLEGFGHVLTFDLSKLACTRLMNIIKGAVWRGNQSVLTPPTFAHACPIHWEYSPPVTAVACSRPEMTTIGAGIKLVKG